MDDDDDDGDGSNDLYCISSAYYMPGLGKNTLQILSLLLTVAVHSSLLYR